MSKCKKDGNQLRELWAKNKEGYMSIEPTYLRWCDKCNTIYILKPEELFPEEMLIPFLEYVQLPQMEVI